MATKTHRQIYNELRIAERILRLARAYASGNTNGQHDIIDEIGARAHRLVDETTRDKADGQ